MPTRLHKWRALPWRDRRRVLAIMLIGLPVMAAALRLFGYVRTRRWLEAQSKRGNTRTATTRELESAGHLAQLTAMAGGRGKLNTTCLRQSLLVYWLLRRQGLAPEHKIGVRKQDAMLDAHAWVDLDGRSLDPSKGTHKPFPSQKGTAHDTHAE